MLQHSKNWKAYLKNPIPNVTHDTTVNTLRTRSIYSSLLNTIFVPPTAETKILSHGFAEKYHPEGLSYAICSHK